MKAKIILSFLAVGFVSAFIQQIIEVSEPPVHQIYEQKHKLKLKFLTTPARGYQFDSLSVHSKHYLYFKGDSSSAITALNHLLSAGYFADSVEKREVFLSNENLNFLIKEYEPNSNTV